MFAQLTSLTSLDLSSNNLTAVPSDWSAMQALSSAVLSENMQLIALPVSLWQLPVERIVRRPSRLYRASL
jgi:Leucine-rich repeat (LRR) protein